MTVNHDVAGSSPAGGAINKSCFCSSCFFGSVSIVGVEKKEISCAEEEISAQFFLRVCKKDSVSEIIKVTHAETNSF